MFPVGFLGGANPLIGAFTSFYNLDEVNNTDNALDSVGAQNLTQNNSPVRQAAFGNIPFCKRLLIASTQYYSTAANLQFSCGDIDYCWIFWYRCTAASYATTMQLLSQGFSNGEYALACLTNTGTPVLRFTIYGGGGTGSQTVETTTMVATFGLWVWGYVEHSASNNTMRIMMNCPTVTSYDSGNVATTKTPAVDTTGVFGFGANAAAGSTFQGELCSWGFKRSGVLTDAQRNAHYNSGNGVTAPF